MRRERRQLTPGDIIEIPTRRGLAYVQFTHDYDDEQCEVVRVVRGFFERRPEDFESLAARDDFVAKTDLRLALKERPEWRIVGRAEIPDRRRALPVFRDVDRDPVTGRARSWIFVEGDRVWHQEQMTPEQRSLPLTWIMFDGALKARIEAEWTPASEGDDPPPGWNSDIESGSPAHWFYFGGKDSATRAAAALQSDEFDTELVAGEDEVAVVVRRVTGEFELAVDAERLSRVAREFGGSYEGVGFE